MADQQYEFLENAFLGDSFHELQKHEQIIKKNERVLLKKMDLLHNRFNECQDSSRLDKILFDSVGLARKLNREKEILETKVTKAEEMNANLREECSNLRSQFIDKQNNVPVLAQEIENLNEKFLELQHDEIGKRSKLDMKQKAILLTKDCYKRHLGCHVRLVQNTESGDIYIFNFENIPPVNAETLPSKSAKFIRAPKKGKWKLLETNPPLLNFEQLSNKLKDSQDIQGLIAYLCSTLKHRRKQT